MMAMKQEAKGLLEHLARLKLAHNSKQQLNHWVKQQEELHTMPCDNAKSDEAVQKIMRNHTPDMGAGPAFPFHDMDKAFLVPFIVDGCFEATCKMKWCNELQESAAMKKLPAEMQTIMCDKIKAFRASFRVCADPASKRIVVTQTALQKQHSWWEPHAQQFFDKCPELMDPDVFE